MLNFYRRVWACIGLEMEGAYYWRAILESEQLGVLLKRGVVSAASSRKIVPITVSHWWLLMMATMDLFWVAVIGPVSFILLNLISLKSSLFKAMEDPESSRNYGTVYFPISLLVLVLAVQADLIPLWVGGVGILVMGWSDGLAALAGCLLHGVDACGVAFAEATADTWASEIGVLSPARLRSILSRKELPAGASGGVSGLGTFASLAGLVYAVFVR